MPAYLSSIELYRFCHDSGECSWCGQRRKRIYRYGTANTPHGLAKGQFCDKGCFMAYHPEVHPYAQRG